MQATMWVNEAAAESVGMDAGRLRALAEGLDRTYVASGKLPHLRLLVSRDEKLLLSHISGKARATGEPLQDDALFRIASMTKPATSIAFMMLAEQGLVALDDPVTTVLPEFADLRVGLNGEPLRHPIRMIDLLRHMSGLTYGLQQRTAIDARYRDLGLDEFHQKRSSDEFIQAVASLPLEFSPGDRWNYSISTDVLGVVVERLSGTDLASFFAERIFQPLGMHDTFFDLPDDKVGRMTDAWQLGPGGRLSLYDRGERSSWRRASRFRSGGGGLVSSAQDYHRFALMLLRGGELDGVRLLRPDTLSMMHANQLPGGADLASLSSSMFSEADYAGVGFGLGFATDLATGEFFWGGVFSTFFVVHPAQRTIGILLTQHFPSNTYPIRRDFRDGIKASIIGAQAPDA